MPQRTRRMSTHHTVVMRLDASVRGGLGHLRRCAVLGRELHRRGAAVHVLARAPDVDARREVVGFAAQCDPMDAARGAADAGAVVDYCRRAGATRLVVDHYDADEAYQSVLLAGGARWLQFDGQPAGPLWADWVLAMQPSASVERYEPLRRRPQTRWLLGPAYALLREEFAAGRGAAGAAQTQPMRTLLCFGGGDDYGATLLSLRALAQAGWRAPVDIALGSAAPRRGEVESWIAGEPPFPVTLHVDADNMVELLRNAGLALIAGGTTSFEAAALGTPSLIIQTAPNQRPNGAAWQALGAALDMGPLERLDAATLGAAASGLAADEQRRRAMAAAGRDSVDGLGAKRVADALLGNGT